MGANFFPLQEQNVINAGPAFPHSVLPDLFYGNGRVWEFHADLSEL